MQEHPLKTIGQSISHLVVNHRQKDLVFWGYHKLYPGEAGEGNRRLEYLTSNRKTSVKLFFLL